MIGNNNLYFYYVTEFNELGTYPELKGKHIISISKLLDLEQLPDEISTQLISGQIVIDLSILTAYTSPQLKFEIFLSKVHHNNILFIADFDKKETLEIELRFCFKKFLLLPSSIKSKGKPKHTKKITDLDSIGLKLFKSKFDDSLYGHAKFKDKFNELIDTFKVFNKLGEHKVLSLFILGESGVGKTEVARAIHKSLGGKNNLAKVNFGNYSDHTSLNSLIGSSRGYIGSDDGEIFKRVRESDTGVILIDEFEKGNPTVYNFFLSALETGIMTNSLSDDINIDGYIIVFTSNISKHNFKNKISPELRSRFDYKCRFSLLYNDDKAKYFNFRLDNIITKFQREFNYTLPRSVKKDLFEGLKIEEFNNMRDLNKEIKARFIEYLESLNDFSLDK